MGQIFPASYHGAATFRMLACSMKCTDTDNDSRAQVFFFHSRAEWSGSKDLLHLCMRRIQHFLLFVHFVDDASSPISLRSLVHARRGLFAESGNGPPHKQSNYH